MGTKISWAEETWNMLGGCTPIAKGCKHCAAAASAQLCVNRGNKKYVGLVKNGKWTGGVRLFPDELDRPLHWRNPRRIFPCFMGDLFHEKVPFEFIEKVYGSMAQSIQHTWLILTKRIKRASEFYEYALSKKPAIHWGTMINVHLGVSISTQAEADEKIPIGLQIPGFDWLSIEPILEAVGMRATWTRGVFGGANEKYPKIDWVVIGAESKGSYPGRECKLEWVRDIVRQCDAASVPVHIKQLHLYRANGRLFETEAKAKLHCGEGKVRRVLVKDIKDFPKDLRRREKAK